jgi:hypothetical protein
MGSIYIKFEIKYEGQTHVSISFIFKIHINIEYHCRNLKEWESTVPCTVAHRSA